MRPVAQLRLDGPPDGDCFAACVASILEVELDRMPDIPGDSLRWRARWLNWAHEVGLSFSWLNGAAKWRPVGYWIGVLDVGDWDHCVVYKNSKIVHNPDTRFSVERTELFGFKLTEICAIIVTDQVKLSRWRRAGLKVAA